MKTLFSIIVLLSCFFFSISQCDFGDSEYLDGNKVKALVNMTTPSFNNPDYASSYEVPKGSGNHVIYNSAYMIGGLDPAGLLRQSRVGANFHSGAYRPSGDYSCVTPQIFEYDPLDRRGLYKLRSGKIMNMTKGSYEVYDPISGTTLKRIIPVNLESGFSGTQPYYSIELPDGRVFVIESGLYHPGSLPSRTGFIDPVHYVYSVGPVLNFGHPDIALEITPSGKVIIASSKGAELFDPVSMTSVIVNENGTVGGAEEAILLSNGKIFFSGGAVTNVSFGSKSTRIFDESTMTFTPGVDLSVVRRYHSLYRLPTGEILIFGGNLVERLIEKYDPVTGTISPAGSLIYPGKKAYTISGMYGKILIGSGRSNSRPNPIQEYNPATESVIEGEAKVSQLIKLSHARVIALGKGEFNPVYRICIIPTLKFEITVYDKIFKVTESQINQFRGDFAAGSVIPSNYPDIIAWPGNGNTNLGEDAQLAPYVDVNGDNLYRPQQDGDYPKIMGQQALWYVLNDNFNLASAGGNSIMGIQMKVMAWAYSCETWNCPDSLFDYSTFYRVEVCNKSNINYSEVYAGFEVDGDLGYGHDDYLGSDSTLNLAYFYNADDDDDWTYGLNPPAVGITTLCTPNNRGLTHSLSYEMGNYTHGIPTTPIDYYNYLRAKWLDGQPQTYNSPGGGSGIPTNYSYPGDPGFCGGAPSGWNEVSSANSPYDRRMVFSNHTGDFPAGETKIYDYAIVWSRAFYNDNLGSVCKLKQDVTTLRDWWPTQAFGCTLPSTAIEISDFGQTFTLFPNPNKGDFQLDFGNLLKTDLKLTILDEMGRVMQEESLKPGLIKAEIHSSHLASGIYFVTISSTEKGNSVFKMLVKQ